MTRLLSCALLLAAAVATDPIATGSWSVTGDVQGYAVTETCNLVQTDAAIAGKCIVGDKERVVTGTVADRNITFSHASEYEGQPLTLTYAGKLDDSGKLSGTIDVQPLNYQGTFSATIAPKQ